MDRRGFLLFCAASSAVGRGVLAQSPARTLRMAALFSTPKSSSLAAILDPLAKQLEALGYVQGQNLAIEGRWAEGDVQRLPALAAEIVRLQPDLIYAAGYPAARAAKDATSTIPIVFGFQSDPVRSGLVNSLDRPGGNLTGTTNLSLELVAKQVELLRGMLPAARRIAVLMTSSPNQALMLRRLQEIASGSHLALVSVRADAATQLDAAFAEFARKKTDALVVLSDPLLYAMRREIADLALRARLPSVFAVRGHADVGGLASYGERMSAALAMQARYIDKLFKGARPSDLPIQQPTDFELIINMKTMRALGINMPKSLLLRADEVIE
jgi:putative tryptophan/tyrosine transport system substrate-binding protein